MTDHEDRLAKAIARMPPGSRELGDEIYHEMLERERKGRPVGGRGSVLERGVVRWLRKDGLADDEIDRRFGWEPGRAAAHLAR